MKALEKVFQSVEDAFEGLCRDMVVLDSDVLTIPDELEFIVVMRLGVNPMFSHKLDGSKKGQEVFKATKFRATQVKNRKGKDRSKTLATIKVGK